MKNASRWVGDGDWRERDTLHRLFESADDPPGLDRCGTRAACVQGVVAVQRRSQCSTTRGLLEGAWVTVTCLRVL